MQQLHHSDLKPTPAETMQAETQIPSLQEQLDEAEHLASELKTLLNEHESALKQEGIFKQIEKLEYWTECYRYGLFAANKISENGGDWLLNCQEKLKQANEDVQRLENEGGNTINPKHDEYTNKIVETTEKLNQIIPEIDRLFECTATD